MSYASLGRLERPWRKDVPEGTYDKWARVAPTVVKESVSIATGSRTTGGVAGAATKVAVESSPRVREIIGEGLRDATYETGTTLLAAVAAPFVVGAAIVCVVHDAFVDDSKKWLK